MKYAALLFALVIAAGPFSVSAQSVFTQRPDDPKAVYLTPDQFPVHADGVADDTGAIQSAIDRVQQTANEGIVFIPSGRYRITRTIYVWPAVRIIGYGATRPVFVLAPNTPGYQHDLGYLFFFAGGRPGYGRQRPHLPGAVEPPTPGTVPANNTVPDANPGTFYSAMSNVDFEIGEGNPAAVAIRFHVAQHCYLSHIDFRIGSGLAALKDIGNEAEDLRFYGGQYGIITQKPSPGWQFSLLDSIFDGQKVAAIREHEAGLTMSHDIIRNTPAAISIDPGYAEELWIEDSRFENISGPALTISNERNARTEINVRNIACLHVPVFALFRESGKTLPGKGDRFVVAAFSHGLTIPTPGEQGAIQTVYDARRVDALPAMPSPAIPALPASETWTNLRSLGAKGDGSTDDTAAIQQAIDAHPVLYVPEGRYVVSNTIHLRPDTVLIGLHPSTTQFDILDGTAAFQGPGAPVPLIETPQGGHNIVTGIGLYTNGINDRAVGALWRSGADSLMDDVRFLGGHGTNAADGTRINPYNNDHSADPDIHRRWDSQYPSLWITNGGGGTFADIWTPSTFAQAGLYISNTSTPGHIYELSSEHHVRNEAKLDHVSNWEIAALQTEEERGESGFALPLEIQDSNDITIANYHSYRVVSMDQPFPEAVRISDSRDIHILNLHVDSDSKAAFDNAVYDQTSRAQVRAPELAVLDIPGHPQPASQTKAPSNPIANGAKLEKLADGFFNISGAAVDPAGQLYFVDARRQRIYRWDSKGSEAVVVRDNPLQPVNLAFDKSGNLLVVSYLGDGTVYTFRPGTPETQLKLIKPQQPQSRPGSTAALPVNFWSIGDETMRPRPWQYVSPDGSLFIPAGNDFVQGQLYYGTKMADVLRAFSLAEVLPGRPYYITDESNEKTWKANVTAAGAFSSPQLFVERGGQSVAQDNAGNVYLAAGQIYVYSPDGKQMGIIDTPERPINLVFGGTNRETLYVLTQTALYSIDLARR